jgi:hypothetical protein
MTHINDLRSIQYSMINVKLYSIAKPSVIYRYQNHQIDHWFIHDREIDNNNRNIIIQLNIFLEKSHE